ncbi:MAG: hypothetical protein HY722_16005 [Planctomycetes bacterium]|nr:hypothetical protein [Planctomycetota bacterium]
MGTFHQDRGALHGITVVVDAGRTVYIGRCDEETQEGIHLVDVDEHEDGAGGQSKEDFIRRAARFGAWVRHPRLMVPRDGIASVTRLGDVVPSDGGCSRPVK